MEQITEQEIAQRALDKLGRMLESDNRRTREGAVMAVLSHSYAIVNLGKVARGEKGTQEDEG